MTPTSDVYNRRIVQPETPIWETQTETVLSGGLDWLSPDDVIGETEAVECSNWRTNANGGLRSRLGSEILNGVGGQINAIYRVGGAQVVSAGGTLEGGGISLSGFSTDPIFCVYWRNWLWITNQARQVKYSMQSNSVAIFTPAAPDPSAITLTAAMGGGGGSPAGGTDLTSGETFTYWITYTTGDGEESNPTSVDFDSEAPNQIAQIQVTAPGDPQITGWNLYRSGGTLNTAYQLPTQNADGSSPNNLGATYTDDGTGLNSDTALLELDIPIEVDHDPPPAAAGVAGPFFGHLLMWNTALHPNRLFWSKLDEPYAWPGSAANSAEGNWVDCGDIGDPILNVTIRPLFALIYKGNQVFLLAGDPDDPNATIEPVLDGFGITGVQAVSRAGTTYVLEGADGIYTFNGSTLTKLSQNIDPIFQGYAPDLAGIAVPRPLADDKSSNCIAHHNGRVYFSYLQADNATRSTLVYDLLGTRWYQDNRGFTALYDEGASGNLLGAVGNNLYALESGGTDQGTPVYVSYHSRYHNQQLVENQKTYLDLVIDSNTNGANMTVSVWFDHGASSFLIPVSLNTASRTLTTFQLGPTDQGIRGHNIAVRVEGTAGDANAAPALLYGWTIHYRVEARDALTWDSGPTDCGDPRAKQCDLLEFEIETNDAHVNVILYGNLPGGTMQSWFTQALPSTSGGRMHLEVPVRATVGGFVLPSFVEGRLLRVVLSSSTGVAFKLYAARLRVRPIGQYLDGSNNEIWLTQEMSPNA